MTTLELARAIATAVLRAGPRRHRDSTRDRPTQAVLETLERRGRWFMRYRVDEDGAIVGGTEQPMEPAEQRVAPRRETGGRRNEQQRGRDDQDGRRRRSRRQR